MKVLLVWQEIPSETRNYELNLTDDQWEIVRHAHGMYIGVQDPGGKHDLGLQYINLSLTDPGSITDADQEFCEDLGFSTNVIGQWFGGVKKDTSLSGLDHFIECGFIF